MAIVVAFLVLELTVVVCAWTCGGRPERGGALILITMVAATYLGRAFEPAFNASVDPLGVAVDLIGLVGFSWIGIASRRIWPLWAASLQVLSTGAHFVRALAIPMHPSVYYVMKTFPTLGVIVLLVAGTEAYQLRERKRRSNS